MTTQENSGKNVDDVDVSSDVREFANRYTVDLIVEYHDTSDNLMLHWGVGRKDAGEWARADDFQLPTGSIRWPDGVATQTPFVKDAFYPEFRSLQLVFEWTEDQEAPVQALNFVVLEKNKELWHNNGGANYQLPIALTAQQ